MDESSKKSTFDRLVAGLDSAERTAMLTRLNQNGEKDIEISNDDSLYDNFQGNLALRLKNESLFYRFFIWLRSIITKTAQDVIYNEDVLLGMAKKINREHPGLLNPQGECLDSLFFERLSSLKSASDFFKPYIYLVDENPGAFYVFLSSFVAPQLSDKINQVADPYNLSDETEATNEIRTDLLRKLDDVLKNMQAGTKSKIYEAVKSIQWLGKLTSLPYLHFISQFTDIKDGVYTCPYVNAKADFEAFSAVFESRLLVQNEVLEALFLFSQKKEISGNYATSDIENSVKKFMSMASAHFATIKMFSSVIPVTTMGKIIFKDYNWTPSSVGGGEDWTVKFRNQWRKIIEIRWSEFQKERRKALLESGLNNDFELTSFPELPNRPWTTLWGGMPFACEMTAGFLGWYVSTLFAEDQKILNTLLMEGIFLKQESRTEFANAMDVLIKTARNISNLLEALDFKGSYGLAFEELSSSSARTFKAQQSAENMIKKIESEVKVSTVDFCTSIRTLEQHFKGIFEEVNDGNHGTLQNFNTIKGHENLKFRDNVRESRRHLVQVLKYLVELESIDVLTS